MSKPLPHSPAPAAAPASVDSHFHVFEAGMAQPGARYVPAYAAPLEAWQQAAVRQGVTRGVLVQTSFMGTDNSHLISQLARHPDTLRGIAVVAPTATLAELQSLHAQGVRGIRLNLAGQSHDMSAWTAARSLWDALLQLGWHVELHTDTGALPAVLAGLPLAMPLVLDHFAKPAQASKQDASVAAVRARRTRGAGSVHVKLSAPYRLAATHPAAQARALAALWLGELGPQALLWGSDWPCTNHEALADYAALHGALDEWLGGDAALSQAIRSTNPLQLYWGTPAAEQSAVKR